MRAESHCLGALADTERDSIQPVFRKLGAQGREQVGCRAITLEPVGAGCRALRESTLRCAGHLPKVTRIAGLAHPTRSSAQSRDPLAQVMTLVEHRDRPDSPGSTRAEGWSDAGLGTVFSRPPQSGEESGAQVCEGARDGGGWHRLRTRCFRPSFWSVGTPQ